jgi:putative addiction module component (TIGR02574 family)
MTHPIYHLARKLVGVAHQASLRYSRHVSARAREVLENALQLTLEERASLVSELIASIDGEPDDDAERAWAAEIERRARRAIAGETTGSDWDMVQARIENKLPPR